MTETADLTERVSRLEGAYEHLATKADIAELRGEFKADIAELKADIAELKGSLKMLLLAMTFILTLLNIGLKVFVP